MDYYVSFNCLFDKHLKEDSFKKQECLAFNNQVDLSRIQCKK